LVSVVENGNFEVAIGVASKSALPNCDERVGSITLTSSKIWMYVAWDLLGRRAKRQGIVLLSRRA
jgi:hypothetical protein